MSDHRFGMSDGDEGVEEGIRGWRQIPSPGTVYSWSRERDSGERVLEEGF
jgi:hypothetical protein